MRTKIGLEFPPENKIPYGTIRPDGYMFNAYIKVGRFWYERWASPEAQVRKKIRSSIRSKKWRLENPEEYVKKYKAYSALNRDRNSKKLREWRKKNPDLHASMQLARRARQCGGISRNCGIVKNIYSAARRITRCTELPFEVDHIVPLAKGGGHTACNLQILSKPLNRRKFLRAEVLCA